jgi:hypothetical protein
LLVQEDVLLEQERVQTERLELCMAVVREMQPHLLAGRCSLVGRIEEAVSAAVDEARGEIVGVLAVGGGVGWKGVEAHAGEVPSIEVYLDMLQVVISLQRS